MDIGNEKNMPHGEKNSVKEVSRRILQTDGNTLTLIIAFIVCVILFISPLMISWVVAYLAPAESIFFVMLQPVAVLILFGGFVFVSLPSIAGYATLAGDIVNGKRSGLLSLFSIYKDAKRYFRVMLHALLTIVYLALAALVFAGGFVQLNASFIALSGAGFFEILSLVAFWLVAFLAAMIIFAYLSSYVFFVPYAYLEGRKLKDAVKESVAASKKCRAQIIKLEFSYLGHLLIGLLSLGVLLVIRCAPKISVSYFVFCNRVFKRDVCGE